MRTEREKEDRSSNSPSLDPPSRARVQVTDEEKELLKADLTAVYGPAGRAAAAASEGAAPWSVAHDTFFKVPWTSVPELVQTRRVLVSRGFAYVSERDQLALLLREFEDRLGRSLEQTAKYLPRLDEDGRLLPILSHLSLSYLSGSTSSDYAFDGGSAGGSGDDRDRFTAEMVDGLARRHFPPCMRHLWEEGQERHHLKHYARLQLGLFLKGVGLSIDEALLFWRRLFAVGTRMAEDKFKKDHVYNIRHSYGLEGGKKNYKPKSCVSSPLAHRLDSLAGRWANGIASEPYLPFPSPPRPSSSRQASQRARDVALS